mgnify:FL=1
MNGTRWLILLSIACAFILTLDARAEHEHYSGPWLRSAIALEARRGIVLDELAVDSSAGIPLDSAATLTAATGTDTLASRLTRAKVKRPESKVITVARGIYSTVMLEGLLAGFTRACVRQDGGGTIFGIMMYGTALFGPAAYNEPIDGRPFHAVSLLSCAASAIVVGTRAMAQEKHPPVNRTRMFQEGFIGFNVVMFLPVVIETVIRRTEKKPNPRASDASHP